MIDDTHVQYLSCKDGNNKRKDRLGVSCRRPHADRLTAVFEPNRMFRYAALAPSGAERLLHLLRTGRMRQAKVRRGRGPPRPISGVPALGPPRAPPRSQGREATPT